MILHFLAYMEIVSELADCCICYTTVSADGIEIKPYITCCGHNQCLECFEQYNQNCVICERGQGNVASDCNSIGDFEQTYVPADLDYYSYRITFCFTCLYLISMWLQRDEAVRHESKWERLTQKQKSMTFLSTKRTFVSSASFKCLAV